MKNRAAIYVLILMVSGFAVYFLDLKAPLFFDDEHFIVENKFIKEISWSNVNSWFTQNSFAGVEKVSEYWRPLMLASFAVNYALDGIQPIGYHLASNLIHIVNGILVFWLMLYALKKYWLAFLVALIFLIHPMQSEGVAYVAGRGDLLASLFMLSGLIVWIKGIENRRPLLVVLSCLSLILALLSRENAVVFPFLAIVFYVSFITGEKFWSSVKNAFLKVIPHLLIVGVYLILRLTVLNFRNFLNFGNVDTDSLYVKHLPVRLYTFFHVLLEYFRTLFYPTNVHERFTFPIHRSLFDWPVAAGASMILFIIIAGVLLYRKENLKHYVSNFESGISHFRMWTFAWGWFFVSLSPGSGIIPTNVIIQDHRLYLALVGIFALLLYYLKMLLNYLKARNIAFVREFVVAILILYLAFFSWITVKRTVIWGNRVALFEETLRYEPDAIIPLNELGVYYHDIRNYEKAEEYFLAAINKGARSATPYYNVAGLRHLFGTKKNLDEAIYYYHKAIEIDPGYRNAYWRLAEIYMENGRDLPKAIYYLQQLHQFYPDDPNIHYNIALVLYLLDYNDAALGWLEKGRSLLKHDPSAQKVFDQLKTKILSAD